ncbi:TPR domain protein [Limimaricola hongkongensis DSM 17492]|uniref:TPR domain protein n=1 Tax=Limimaricola hongkongensis DSM 17492 TaxID=1122180 RepID=A0A017H9B7_9RHOB|nr:TPR domain protein [Limimaricola hongkongensis DSM 17492]
MQAQEDDGVAGLFERLQAASPEQTPELAAEIRAAWSRSGSAAIDLLVERGREALGAGDRQAAIEHLTAALDHAPGFAEAHVLRANAYYLAGLTGPAIDDLRRALDSEPRHFGALQGFAALLEEIGRPEDAREVWGRVLALMPQDARAIEAARRLDIMLGGRTL